MKQKYIKSVILYALCGIVCFADLKQLWLFVLIFFGLAVFYLWLAYRHRDDEPTMLDNVKQQAKDYILKNPFKEKKERKAQYLKTLAEIEAEFSMDDYDKYDEDEESE